MDSQQNSSHPRLALIELAGADAAEAEAGAFKRAVDVHAWPITLGRALDNHIVIDDPFVAAHHARIGVDDAGALTLTVLDTVNGVDVGFHHAKAGESLALTTASSHLKLGNTRIQLRLPNQALLPEQALPFVQRSATAPSLATPVRSRAWPWLTGAGLLAFQAASQWTALDPGADFSAWLPLLFGVPVALVLWCGVWALLSKLFNHHFDFTGHLKLALPWMLAIAVAQAMWPQLAASLALPSMWRLTPLLVVVLTAFLVRAHLAHVLPNKRQAVSVGVVAMALGSIGITVAGNYRSHDSLSSAAYMSTLPLPALRLSGTGGEQKLVQGLAPLAAQLAVRVKKARDDEEEGDDAGE